METGRLRLLHVQGFSRVVPRPLPLPPQEYPLAALAGTACHCGFPTTRFPLHEREDEQLCAQKCSAEEFESCGTPSYFIVYQTQVQGKPGLVQRPRVFSQGLPPRGAWDSPPHTAHTVQARGWRRKAKGGGQGQGW